MEINSFISSHLQAHYKKLLLLCTVSATVYVIMRYVDKKRRLKMRKEKKKIKDFPTIEEIQKFIEDLPFDAVNSGKAVTLKDLLGELSEFSEDEDWKELIASVHTMYQDNGGANKENPDDTGSIISIYEDPNVITLNGLTPRDEITDALSPKAVKFEEQTNENKGNGDAKVGNIPNTGEKTEDNDLDSQSKNLGEGDNREL